MGIQLGINWESIRNQLKKKGINCESNGNHLGINCESMGINWKSTGNQKGIKWESSVN